MIEEVTYDFIEPRPKEHDSNLVKMTVVDLPSRVDWNIYWPEMTMSSLDFDINDLANIIKVLQTGLDKINILERQPERKE